MNMQPEKYNLEEYWDNVASNISVRSGEKIIAGDDEPYYRYKRQRFLKLLDSIVVANKKVLEVGSGPGGNLLFLCEKQNKELVGVDVSQRMIEISRQVLQGKGIKIVKTKGASLPFSDNYFNVVFTSTVLQHNTDEIQLKELIRNLCRVSNSDVIIFERIEKKIVGHITNIGRPVNYYKNLFEENGYQLHETKFLPIQASYFVCGAIRKIFNSKARAEGEPLNNMSLFLEKLLLPFTKLFDRIIPSKRDLAMLFFKKK